MSAVDGEPLLEVEDLHVHFASKKGVFLARKLAPVRAVDGVNFTIANGEVLGLVGESGSGKTTTGRAILRLVRPTSGRIVFEGRDVADRGRAETMRLRRRVQMIFQNPFASLNPRMTVGNVIADPLRVHGIGSRAGRVARVGELLDLVGLDPRVVNRYPHQFSGGQRQRIGIARALAVDPALLICDEPVSALDVSVQAQILNLLQDVRTRLGLSYLVISHDLAVVRHLCDRIAVMYLGRLVEVTDRDTLYAAPLHPYTRGLLAAVRVPDPKVERGRRHRTPAGEVPSAARPPAGCRFHPRCWLREELGRPDECVSVQPELRMLGNGHHAACHFAEQGAAGSWATAPVLVVPKQTGVSANRASRKAPASAGPARREAPERP